MAADGSRPDLVCFDAVGEKRIIVEAKFWAGLMEEQPNAYLEQLPQAGRSGRSALLFIVPEVRSGTLWAAINKMVTDGGIQMDAATADPRIPTARVSGTEKYLMLARWSRLLDGMLTVAEDSDIRAEIAQLRGLAQRQDEDAFLPLHAEELSPAFARRMRGFVRLVDDAVTRGVEHGWVDTEGRGSGSTRDGYGRNFRFSDTEEVWWFGMSFEQWTMTQETPLWIYCWRSRRRSIAEVTDQSRFRIYGVWIAIHLKTGVEYDEVLDDVVRQLREIGDVARSATNATQQRIVKHRPWPTQ